MSIRLFRRLLKKCGQTISVKKRSLEESGFESSQPVVVLTEIDTPLAIPKTIESIRGGDKLFSGVSIDPSATHVFCTLYSLALVAVERDNYYITLKGEDYRVVAVTNINERDKVLALQAVKRGDETKEAVKA